MERRCEIAVEQLFTPDTIDKFTEFSGRQLFEEGGPFKGISKEQRFIAIEVLLHPKLGIDPLPFVYCAIDRKKINTSVLAGSDVVNFAFNNCLLGIDEWALRQPTRLRDMIAANPETAAQRTVQPEHFVLVIVDEPHGVRVDQTKSRTAEAERRELEQHRLAQERKDVYRRTYQRLRKKFLPTSAGFKDNKVWQLHDAMYFGDSRDSVGLQMADLRCYFMSRFLRGDKHPDVLRFFDLFKSDAICARYEIEKLGEFMVCHEDVI